MATVTKRDLVVRVSNETGLTQQQVFNVIQKTLDETVRQLTFPAANHSGLPGQRGWIHGRHAFPSSPQDRADQIQYA